MRRLTLPVQCNGKVSRCLQATACKNNPKTVASLMLKLMLSAMLSRWGTQLQTLFVAVLMSFYWLPSVACSCYCPDPFRCKDCIGLTVRKTSHNICGFLQWSHDPKTMGFNTSNLAWFGIPRYPPFRSFRTTAFVSFPSRNLGPLPLQSPLVPGQLSFRGACAQQASVLPLLSWAYWAKAKAPLPWSHLCIWKFHSFMKFPVSRI